jgi:hypothetical protein
MVGGGAVCAGRALRAVSGPFAGFFPPHAALASANESATARCEMRLARVMRFLTAPAREAGAASPRERAP